MSTNIRQIISFCLPKDVSVENIFSENLEDVPQSRILQVLEHSLRNNKIINWTAYLENYLDVKNTGIDPVIHFVNHGIFEGRKLYSHHPLCVIAPIKENTPRVTVIITNYNNALFLNKCIESVIEQTIKDIEIVVVDDRSTDNSLAVLEELSEKDNRIKLICMLENSGTHIARKIGVLNSSGDYIIFLDADDYLEPFACETAWSAVAKGFDMAAFNANMINHARLDETAISQCSKLFNSFPAGIYDKEQIKNAIFIDRNLMQNLITKIFLREVLQAAFAEMKDGRYIIAEDLYELLIISQYIRNMVKINSFLYNYSCGTGISWERRLNINPARTPRVGPVYLPIAQYCRDKALPKIFKRTKDYFIWDAIQEFKTLPSNYVSDYFHDMVDMFGPLECTIALMNENFYYWSRIANVIKHVQIANKQIKRIGLFYFRISIGGVETTISNLCKIFIECGYEVSVFLQEKTDYDIKLPSSVKIYYIHPHGNSKEDGKKHLNDLYSAVIDFKIDILFHMVSFYSFLLWDLILMHAMNISVVTSLRLDHNSELIWRGKPYKHSHLLNVLKCTDKVFCLTISTELYLRTQGIDAIYIPNPIRELHSSNLPLSTRDNTIVVIARLDEAFKRIDQALYVLKDVSRIINNVNMVFIGEFNIKENMERFLKKVEDLHLECMVEITGWVSDPSIYINKAKVLLSTSYIEGFPNGIAEAQSLGIPVVAYEIDIAMKKDNPSLQMVPQGDHQAAANIIVSLLQDENLWTSLSEIARKASARYSFQRFEESILNLIHTYDNQSIYRRYTPADYNRVISMMCSYLDKGVPNWT